MVLALTPQEKQDLVRDEGEKAIDVFYLSHQGSKLSAQLKENLGDRIVQAIT